MYGPLYPYPDHQLWNIENINGIHLALFQCKYTIETAGSSSC
jgi:hypothetical protein